MASDWTQLLNYRSRPSRSITRTEEGRGVGRRSPEEVDFGDVTNDVLKEIGIDDDTVTKPDLEFGGGVEFPAGALLVDIGYRLRTRVRPGRPQTLRRVYVGVGARSRVSDCERGTGFAGNAQLITARNPAKLRQRFSARRIACEQ